MFRSSAASARLFVFASIVVAAACSGSTDSPPTGVTPPPIVTVASVVITPPTAAIIAPQATQFTATPKDAAGNALSGQSIAWSVTPSAVATVNSSGLVTGVSAGTATVVATTGGQSASAVVTVGVVESATIGPAGGTMTVANGNVTLVFPAGALTASTQITVTPVLNQLTTGLLLAGPTYELGPTGTQFAQPVSLSIKYPTNVGSSVNASRMLMYTLAGNTWTEVAPSAPDTVTHTVTASLKHFSIYGPCEYPCYSERSYVRAWMATGQYGMDAGTTWHAYGHLWEHYYTGPATVTVVGLPSSITANATGNLDHDNADLALNFTATAGTPGGIYPFTIVTKAPNVPDDSTHDRLFVTGQSYTFTASPTAITLTQGGTATTTLNFDRVGSFPGTFALTAENLPSGVTATFAPASVTGSSSTLTLRATANATLGGATPLIRAKTTPLADATAVLNLFVTTTNVSGFSVAGTPAFVHLSSTGISTTGIQVTRTGGFSGTVTYAASGMPAGLSATITPTSVTDSVSLKVTTSGLAPGDYPINITATSGAVSHDAVVTVGVAPVGQLAMHLDYSTCTGARPVWVAFQDGNAAFTRITGVGNVYDFTMTSLKGAVAVVSPNATGFTTTVTYGTQAEFSALASTISCAFVPVGKLVYASAVGATGDVQLAIGGGFGFYDHTLLSGSIAIPNVAIGLQDASAFMLSSSPKMILRRDQDIANAGSLAPFDFGVNSTEAFTPASAHVSAPGANAVNMAYYTRGQNCPLTTIYNSTSSFSPLSTLYGVPSARQRDGDLHAMYAVSGSAASYTSVVNIFHTLTDQSVSFGAPLNSAAVTSVASVPYRQLATTSTLASDYQSLSFSYGDATNTFTLVASTAYAGNTVSLSAPAFASGAGYSAAWAPSGAVHYSLNANSNNFVTRNPTLACTDGMTTKSAIVTGSVSP